MPELAGQHVCGGRKPWDFLGGRDLGLMATKDTTKTNPAGEFMKPLSQNLELPTPLCIKLKINIQVIGTSQANVLYAFNLPSHLPLK